MKRDKHVILWFCACLLFNMACAKKLYLHRFYPDETFAKMVYVGDEVQRLKTEVLIPNEKLVYVEVRTKQGKLETGKLIRATEWDLYIGRRFHFAKANDGKSKIDHIIVIPKGEILILKVWQST